MPTVKAPPSRHIASVLTESRRVNSWSMWSVSSVLIPFVYSVVLPDSLGGSLFLRNAKLVSQGTLGFRTSHKCEALSRLCPMVCRISGRSFSCEAYHSWR